MQIVSISSLKGGVGKSTVTLGLASAALHARLPTLVIDLDPHADASTALGVRAGSGGHVGDALRHPARGALTKVTVASPWTRHPITPRPATPAAASAHSDDAAGSGSADEVRLDVAPGSAASSALDRAQYRGKDLRRLERVLEDVSGYDLVLIDCPPSLSALTRMAWAVSHQVLSVAEPSLFSVAGTKRTMTALAQAASGAAGPAPAAGVVINRVRSGHSEHEHRVAELHELFGSLVVAPQLPERPVVQQAQGAAWPVHRWPGADAAEIAERFDTILDRLRR